MSKIIEYLFGSMAVDDRRGERHAASGQVLYSIGGIVHRDELYNLSRDGCMIAARHGFAHTGDKIEITLLRGMIATGRIAWSEERAFGVRFDAPVSDEVIRFFRLTDWAELSGDGATGIVYPRAGSC